MARPRKMTAQEIESQLATLEGWQLEDNKLRRELTFADFVQAFGFMAQVALLAEARDHHPDWSNVYNRVTIDLHTHDAGGITELDVTLARAIDGVAARMR